MTDLKNGFSVEKMPPKHGFKKEKSKASPSKPPKVYNDYVYDIGDRLTGSDLDNRIGRFEATYSMKSLATTVGITHESPIS